VAHDICNSSSTFVAVIMPSKRSKAAAAQPLEVESDDRKAPKRQKAEPKEKRLDSYGSTVRYKSRPTIKDLERIERALGGFGVRQCLKQCLVSWDDLRASPSTLRIRYMKNADHAVAVRDTMMIVDCPQVGTIAFS
jgi:hypothetical protein